MNHLEEVETGLSEEEEIYKENILDHYKDPHNKGEIEHNATEKELNPICGDEITIYLDIKEERVNNVSFMGHGCAISQASVSMLTDKIKGLNITEVKSLKSDDIYKLLGIPISVARIKCALLSLKAVNSAIKRFTNEIRSN